jgi:hypothetical protein
MWNPFGVGPGIGIGLGIAIGLSLGIAIEYFSSSSGEPAGLWPAEQVSRGSGEQEITLQGPPLPCDPPKTKLTCGLLFTCSTLRPYQNFLQQLLTAELP